jgi:alkanesulfonate monooxygenase SsuD/methylene tetrahydromethanopterin reductase-like flavin-dependent oxidoreductase (luciferase family)
MQYYQEALQQVCWAEQLGFHSVWFTEHHFSRHGIVPASLTVLAYLAGVTTSIRLGIAVAVLPFHNPIQLAEQKVLDSLELFATQVTPLFKD